MTKKSHQKFWRMKSINFWGKRWIGKISLGVWKIFGIRRKSETGGEMHHCLGGMDAPAGTCSHPSWNSFDAIELVRFLFQICLEINLNVH